jgi:hypothetical protein
MVGPPPSSYHEDNLLTEWRPITQAEIDYYTQEKNA